MIRLLLRITNIECIIWRFDLNIILGLLFGRRGVLCLGLLALLSLYLGIQLLNVLASCHICKVSLVSSSSLTCSIGFVCNVGCICLVGDFRLGITLTYLGHLWRWVHTRLYLLWEYYWGCCVWIQHIKSVVWNEHFLIVIFKQRVDSILSHHQRF